MMVDKNEKDKNINRGTRKKKPTAKDFSAEAVNRAVLAETFQHPTTILPLALMSVAVIWSLAFAWSAGSLLFTLISGFAGGVSWIVNYFLRGDFFAEKHVKRLRKSRTMHKELEAFDLKDRCAKAGFIDGEREAGQLNDIYLKLRDFLKSQSEGRKNLHAERFLILAEDTYQEGLEILQKALNIHNVLKSIDVNTLRRELREYKDSRKDSKRKRDDLDDLIRSHQKRIDSYNEYVSELKELIIQVDGLEAALENALLTSSSLINKDSAEMFREEGAGTQLERAIEAARRVEKKLSSLSSNVEEGDEVYLQHTNEK